MLSVLELDAKIQRKVRPTPRRTREARSARRRAEELKSRQSHCFRCSVRGAKVGVGARVGARVASWWSCMERSGGNRIILYRGTCPYQVEILKMEAKADTRCVSKVAEVTLKTPMPGFAAGSTPGQFSALPKPCRDLALLGPDAIVLACEDSSVIVVDAKGTIIAEWRPHKKHDSSEFIKNVDTLPANSPGDARIVTALCISRAVVILRPAANRFDGPWEEFRRFEITFGSVEQLACSLNHITVLCQDKSLHDSLFIINMSNGNQSLVKCFGENFVHGIAMTHELIAASVHTEKNCFIKVFDYLGHTVWATKCDSTLRDLCFSADGTALYYPSMAFMAIIKTSVHSDSEDQVLFICPDSPADVRPWRVSNCYVSGQYAFAVLNFGCQKSTPDTSLLLVSS